jgi:hypothetical protein
LKEALNRQSADELAFKIELPYPPSEARARLAAACDFHARADGASGLRPLWGSVDETWFRVRAIRVGRLGPVAEGYIVASGTGSQVSVGGELEPDGKSFARQIRWWYPLGGVGALAFVAVPGARLPGLLVGTLFLTIAWRGRRWQRMAARETRRVILEALTGPPPVPEKWRPRLPVRDVS